MLPARRSRHLRLFLALVLIATTLLHLPPAQPTEAGVSTFAPVAGSPFLTGGIAPRGAVLFDVNGDNKLDLVTANATSNTISVFLNTGSGFGPLRSYPSGGTTPVAVAVADLNGDTKPDLVVANNGSANTGNVAVLLGNGDGTFQPAVAYGSLGNNAVSVAIADLNNDTKPDLVVANTGANNVSVLLGNGNGTFQTAQTFSSGGNSPIAVVVASVNPLADTLPDLVVANNAGNNVGVLLGNGNGTFQSAIAFPTGGTAPSAVAVADLGNGKPDLVVTNATSNNVSVLLGNGTGTIFTAATGSPYATGGTTPVGVAIADFDGDTRLDLAIHNRGGAATVGVLLGNGTGTLLTPASTVGTGAANAAGTVGAIVVGDVNGDTRPDVVTANADSPGTVSVLLNRGTPPGLGLTAATNLSSGVGTTTPVAVAVANLNPTVDGFADLVVANNGSSSVSVLLSNGNGTFAAAAGSPLTANVSNPVAVAVADVNNDNKPDIVVLNNPGTPGPDLTIFFGDGTGAFPTNLNFHVGDATAGPAALAIANLNPGTDTLPDIVVANTTTNQVTVLMNTGGGVYLPAASSPFTAGTSPVAVAIADLGNGHPDIVVANNTSPGGVSVLIGDGSLNFGAPTTLASGGNNAAAVAVADLNGDSQPDLVVANRTSNSLGVLLGNGVGVFQPALAFASGGTGPVSVALADLDGDGKREVVAYNRGSAPANLGVLRNTSAALALALAPAITFNTTGVGGGSAGALAVGDVNGDGRSDLVTANGDSPGTLNLFQNSPAVLNAATILAAGASSPFAIAVADLNGDNAPDLVSVNQGNAPQQGGGTVSVLLSKVGGGYQAPITFPSGAGLPISVAVGDLNGDNFPDIVVGNNLNPGSISVLMNTAASPGIFQPAVNYNSGGNNARGVALADFNGDGKLDIVVANQNSVNVGVLLNNGNGTFGSVTTYGSNGGPVAVAVADLNPTVDHFPDLAVVNQTTPGTVTLLFGNGDGTFTTSPTTLGTGGNNPAWVAVGDVNGDGLPDLAVSNQNSQSVGVLLSNGTGTFQAVQTSPSGGTTPMWVALGDVDGDGKLDLAVANNGSTNVGLLLGNGNGTFQPPSANLLVSPGGPPTAVALADLDGSGTLDLATVNAVNNGPASLSALLNRNGTRTTLVGAPASNTSVFGQPVTFTATVTATFAGAGTPTGTVTFKDGAAVLGTGTLNGAGQASFTTSTLAVSPPAHVVTAAYNGDTSFAASTAASAITQTVNKADTATQLNSSANPSGFGQSVTFTATVSANSPSAGTPTGSVAFKDGATTLGTGTLSGGIATFTTATLTVNTGPGHSLTAVYTNADGNYNNSTSPPLAQVVNPADTTTALTLLTSPSVFGQSVSFVATVTGNSPGTGTPTGTVTFKDGAATLGTGPLNGAGQASFTTSAGSPLAFGGHSISAVYGGDSNFNPSTSTIAAQTVNQASTSTTLTAAPNPAVAGQAINLVAAVSPSAPGAGTPTGTVTFKDGVTTLGTGPLSSGVASFNVPGNALGVGPHALSAVYSGDVDFATSTSANVNLAVNPPASVTLVVAGFPAPTVAGAAGSVTVTARDSSGNVVVGYAGTVHFTSSDPQAGLPADYTFTAGDNGVHTFTNAVALKTAGIQTLSATDTVNPSISGTQASIQVNPGNVSSLAVAGFPSPTAVGAPGAFTVTAKDAFGNTVTGFADNIVFGSTDPNASLPGNYTFTPATDHGTHSFVATLRTVGTQAISATDTSVGGVAGSQPNIQVGKSASTSALNAFPATSTVGQTVSFFVTVSSNPAGGGTPTGNVDLKEGPSTLGSGTLANGSTTINLSNLTPGSHSIVAVYAGDANFTGSTSPATNVGVNQPAAATATATATGTATATATGTSTSGGPTATATATATGTAVAGATATATVTGTASSVGPLRLINPVRVVDTRSGPSSPDGPIGRRLGGARIPTAQLQANTTTRFLVAGQTFAGFTFPSDVAGLLLNATIVTPQASVGGGYVVVFPGDAVAPPNASTVNPMQLISHNFWSVGVPRTGANAGTIQVFTTTTLDLVLDVVGLYAPSNPATLGNLKFVNPVRVVDTRGTPEGPVGFDGTTGNPITPGAFAPNTVRRYRVAGKSFGSGANAQTIPADATGLLLHITTIQGSGTGGYVTVFDASQPAPPNASTVNPSTAIAFNSWAAVVPSAGANAGDIAVFSTNALDVAIDVVGVFSPSQPATLGNFTFTDPTRVVDTRAAPFGPIGFQPGGAPIAAGPLTPGITARYQLAGRTFGGVSIPADATGVILNVTLVSAGVQGGYVVAFPGDQLTPPNASTVNPSTLIAASWWGNGLPVPTAANPGAEAIFSTDRLDVVVDLLGYYR